MANELSVLFGTGIAYLLILFLIAYASERGLIPESWVRNPWTYTLSLGVYATSWTYYGSVGFAQGNGLLFLTIYLGVTIAFVMAPLLLEPIARLCRDYQLTSLADVFALRYRSQLAGILVALFMLVGTLPYVALQIRAVTESVRVLTDEAPPHVLALGFCLTLILFAILFGARHISPREKHRGLVAAIAFESLVKLVALLLAGLFAVFGVFGGLGEMGEWLNQHPAAIEALYAPVGGDAWFTLLLLAFAAAFLLPRQFHMTFVENLDPRSLRIASWAFPAFLLLLNLSILPILWAGNVLQLEVDADYYVLGITLAQGPDWLSVLVFLGGVSAASAMVIVTTLALSAMSLNHLLLPASYPDPSVDLYRWLLWGRRLLIAAIILAGYGFYALLEHNQGLVQLGLISFVAVAQFLPGVVGLLWWRRANRTGFLAGLLGGMTVWGIILLAPLMQHSGLIQGFPAVSEFQAASGMGHWQFATFWSLLVNGLLFVTGSLLSRQRSSEMEVARACCSDSITLLSGVVSATSPQQFEQDLAGMLGKATARREVTQALRDLGLEPSESRPTELRRLRERIERNLSGLIGPQLAHVIINRRLELDAHAKTALADSMRYVEERLEESRSRLEGLSVDLDRLRRYHRQILQDLPLGVCAVSPDNTVVIWNLAMEVMSGVRVGLARGRSLSELPEPWNEVLTGFLNAADDHLHQMQVTMGVRNACFNLHKAEIADPDPQAADPYSRPGRVMLLEDLSDLEALEAELAHSDRLASVGRLAAGVAHEIGNPVTGIASLAQNLRDEIEDEFTRQSVEGILSQTRRISRIVQTLSSFSRGEGSGPRSERFAVGEIIEEALSLIRLTRKQKQLRFLTDFPAGLDMDGDRQHLSQVLLNLLANAADASEAGGEIGLSVQVSAGEVHIRIEDRGGGIPEDQRELVFEPFYTTKQPGQGTGLGLALVYRIIQAHRGRVDIEEREGGGTRVALSLPQYGVVT